MIDSHGTSRKPVLRSIPHEGIKKHDADRIRQSQWTGCHPQHWRAPAYGVGLLPTPFGASGLRVRFFLTASGGEGWRKEPISISQTLAPDQ
jgi:hypothetical protein